MEYIKFGKDTGVETQKESLSECNNFKKTTNNAIYNSVKRIEPVKKKCNCFKKEMIVNLKETVTDRKNTDEYDDLNTPNRESTELIVRESIPMKVLCGVMAAALLFIGVYLSQIRAPEYIESAVMALVKRAEEVSETQVNAEEKVKTIGAKILVENNEETETKENGDSEEKKENLILENNSFAQTIKDMGATASKKEDEEAVVMAERDEEFAVEVVAKNMSRGIDKLYFANKTDLDIDLNDYLSAEYPIEKAASAVKFEPRVLIIHTHGTEAYLDTAEDANSRSKDTSKNIVRVGEELQKVLTSYGIPTIHSRTMHDEVSYVNAYANSKKEAKQYLEKYPSIKYIIDVHRDALGTETSPVKTYTEINGKKTAQLMFVMGTNAAGGNHPNYEKNLTTAAHLYKEANVLFPSLMRPVSIRPIIFNQDLTVGSMILEVGSNANTLEEAISAVRMFGRVLAEKEVGFRI